MTLEQNGLNKKPREVGGLNMSELLKVVFDEEEARGEVVITRSAYGIEIKVDGKHSILVDLFHFAQPSDEDGPLFQVVLYHPDHLEDEPTAHIRQWADGRVVVLANQEHDITMKEDRA